MAASKKKSTRKKSAARRAPPARPRAALGVRLRRFIGIALVMLVLAVTGLMALFSVVAPPSTPYMIAERGRLGQIDQAWVPAGEIAPAMMRAAVAAEDANFCLHWGFDMNAIRAAALDGASRGGSTISQQTVKNVCLWQGRSWPRKAIEAAFTPLMELLWTKRRILEVYLNVIEFDEGIFGIDAAAQHHFGKTPAELSPREAALLAAVLPDPKGRSAVQPGEQTRRRAAAIADGAATIGKDGRAACFES